MSTQSERDLKLTEAIVYGWNGGKARGIIEERERLAETLRPYLQHIGNCGAVGSDDPHDSRCICGLRQVCPS